MFLNGTEKLKKRNGQNDFLFVSPQYSHSTFILFSTHFLAFHLSGLFCKLVKFRPVSCACTMSHFLGTMSYFCAEQMILKKYYSFSIMPKRVCLYRQR